MNAVERIALERLVPHPQNPRIAIREDVVAAIQANLTEGFDPAHSLIVRPVADCFEILSGHHRYEAAKRAGLADVPCWVRNMDDDAAYMALVTSNSQGELSPLEIGMHALHCVGLGEGGRGQKGGLSEYARKVGKDRSNVRTYREAAKVAENVGNVTHVLHDKTAHLSAIHALPRECWQAAVEAMIAANWSAKETGAAVERANELLSHKPRWLLAKPDVVGCMIAPAKAKSVSALYRALDRMSEQLPEAVTLYKLRPTDDVKEMNGREFRRHDPEPYEIRPRGEFQSWVNDQGDLSLKAAEDRYHRMSHRVHSRSEPSEEWHPVLTDGEQAEKDRREAELMRIERRQKLMPTLICGDVLEELRAMPSASFDLVCIDPPYNMDKADWDSLGSGAEFADWAEQWLTECRRVLKDSGAIYVFGINRMLSHIQHRMDGLGLRYRSWITWDTIQGAGGGLWVNRSESLLYYSKTDKTYEDADAVKLPRHEENVREYRGKEYAFKNPSNVWRFPCVDEKHPERTDHPTQKPVELIQRIVQASCPPGGRVLDCFIGSGTTGVACMTTGRVCVGIDISREYLAIAQARLDECEVPS